jgi:hypothetical protein
MLSFPAAYLVLFSFFQRAYPRHVVVLLPFFALLAARAVEWCFEPRSRFRWLPYGVTGLLLAAPLVGTIQLGLAARRVTPAARAAEWIEANLPAGSRILEDQYTPRLDPDRYRVHRLRVEEQVFAGNYNWVLHSGYPPGLPLRGLRAVMKFPRAESLGTTITLYEVPDREALMKVTLGGAQGEAILAAGELPFFGEGWLAPSPGAFGTSRLSDGTFSEIFFVLEKREERGLQSIIRAASVAPAGRTLQVQGELNGHDLGSFDLQGEEPRDYRIVLWGEKLQEGLNRFVFRYGQQTVRLNRRQRQAALRFYQMRLIRGR